MSDSVPVVLKDLPTRIRGFVCLGSDYNPCIIIAPTWLTIVWMFFLHFLGYMIAVSIGFCTSCCPHCRKNKAPAGVTAGVSFGCLSGIGSGIKG